MYVQILTMLCHDSLTSDAFRYLIEGKAGEKDVAVLVTGDIRAEQWWCTALRHNPIVSKFVQWDDARHGAVMKALEDSTKTDRRLDCIYLDTSSLADEELVPKAEAVAEVCRHMSMYPPNTKFFLNCWTWGYEVIAPLQPG